MKTRGVKQTESSIVKILGQIAIHAPKNKSHNIAWVREMKLPPHIKQGLDLVEEQGDIMQIMLYDDPIGYIKYNNSLLVGVYKYVDIDSTNG